MNTDENAEAFGFLRDTTFPDEKRLDGLTSFEVDTVLEDAGYDVAKLNERITTKKVEWAGRFALLAARQKRLANIPVATPFISVPGTKDALLQALASLEDLPIAAQRCKGMSYEELVILYRDVMGGRK